MSRFTIHYLAGVAIHYPHRFAVVSETARVGELCRAQTEAKAQRVQLALAVLERYERGELVERDLISV